MPRVAAPLDVRESVLDAARRLLDTHGFKKMTMESIAHEARIGKATIYGYFANKEDVALSVIRRHQETVRARWQEIALGDEPPEQRLRRMLVGLVLAGFDRAQCCRQSMDETLAALRPLILQRRFEFNAELSRLLADVLKEGCDAGRFACADCESGAHTIITALSGLNPTNLSPQELGERKEIERRTNQVIDLIMTGLLIRPSGPTRSKG